MVQWLEDNIINVAEDLTAKKRQAKRGKKRVPIFLMRMLFSIEISGRADDDVKRWVLDIIPPR